MSSKPESSDQIFFGGKTSFVPKAISCQVLQPTHWNSMRVLLRGVFACAHFFWGGERKIASLSANASSFVIFHLIREIELRYSTQTHMAPNDLAKAKQGIISPLLCTALTYLELVLLYTVVATIRMKPLL